MRYLSTLTAEDAVHIQQGVEFDQLAGLDINSPLAIVLLSIKSLKRGAKMRLTKLISFSIMPDFLREVEKVAKEENRTKSELIREALRRYIEDREWEKLTRYARRKSAEIGIKTEEDIQRVVDEHRGEPANA